MMMKYTDRLYSLSQTFIQPAILYPLKHKLLSIQEKGVSNLANKIITAELQIAVLGGENDSLSPYISSAVKSLDREGIMYQITPMGTAIQAGSLDEIFDACKHAHEAVMDMGVNRVLTHITVDHRLKGCKGLNEKVESVRSKL